MITPIIWSPNVTGAWVNAFFWSFFLKNHSWELFFDSSIYKNLYGSDILDMSKYDMVVNMDDVSLDTATNLISNAITSRSVS